MLFNRLSRASENPTTTPDQSNLSPDELTEIERELRAGGETRLLAEKDALPETRKIEDPALKVSFSPSSDEIFNTSVSVTLGCSVEGTRIFYALDSKEVDENCSPFDPQSPILLTQSTLVSAKANRAGTWGPLQSEQFDVVKPVWRELEPTDQSDSTPHKIGGILDSQGWHIAAGSVRGKLHAHRGSWREDSFGLDKIETDGSEWLVVTVSDGAGSAPLSRVGSKLACDNVLESLATSLGALHELAYDKETLVARDLPPLRQALMQAGADALNAVKAEATVREKPVSAFAATLLVLVLREWQGSWLCAALQVGDGAIALWDGEKIVLMGEADHGQNSGETRFLTTTGIENELAARVKFAIKEGLQGFAVMSDGVSDDFFPEDPKLADLFEAVLPRVQKADDAGQDIVSWLGYEKRGSSDDRTLVIGWEVDNGG